MDHLNTIAINNNGTTRTSFQKSKNLTLDQFKKRLFDSHIHVKSPKSFKLPQIQLSINENKFNTSITSDSTISKISFLSTISNIKSFNEKKRTSSTFNNPNELEEAGYVQHLEKDINPLTSYYHFTETQSFNNKLKNFQYFSEKEKSDLFTKYKISNNNSSLNEENKKRNLNTTKLIIHNEFFENPASSLNKIQFNKQIHDNVMNISMQKQADKYISEFNKERDKNKKISNMPLIRTSASHFGKLKEKNDKLVKNNTYQMSNKDIRDQALIGGLEFKGEQIIYYINKPKSRAHASITYFEGKLFLFGGVNNSAYSDIWVNDLKDKFRWNRVKIKEEPIPRYGHTAVLFKNEIYIYGGMTDNNYCEREDILIFDLEKMKFKTEQTYNKLHIKWRRNHATEMVGNLMVVYGGIDDEGHLLDDLWVLDLNLSMRWNYIEVKGIKQKALAHHCSTLVLSSDKRNHPLLNIFKFPDLPLGRTTIKGSKYEGIVYFGGIDDEGNVNNELRILKIGRKPLEWIIPNVSGSMPQGRLNATINYYEILNVLILFGGQNQTQDFSNDLHLLNLNSLEWIRVFFYGDIPSQRSSHCSIIHHNQLIIFGGINAEKYVGSDIFMVNLDIFQKKSNSLNNFNKKVQINFPKSYMKK